MQYPLLSLMHLEVHSPMFRRLWRLIMLYLHRQTRLYILKKSDVTICSLFVLE